VVVLCDQYPVAQNPVNEIGGRAVQSDEVHAPSDCGLHGFDEVQPEALERVWRFLTEQDSDIDVAGSPSGAPGVAPEQVGTGDPLAFRAKDGFQGGDQVSSIHSIIIGHLE